MDKLEIYQLRKVLDTLYSGEPETMLYLAQIRAFYAKKKDITREHRVYLWLVKNGLTGKKLVNFFLNEGGFLNGMNTIINFIEGTQRNRRVIKADELI